MALTQVAAGLAPLIPQYDGFLLDQWGVLHDGARVFPGALAALEALRAAGKAVVILSNSGKRAAANEHLLQRLGVGAELYTAMITSGETAWRGFQPPIDPDFADLGPRCLFFSRGDDTSACAGLALTLVDTPEQADFVWLSGLDGGTAAYAHIQAQLALARQRSLVLLCSNPDSSIVDNGQLVPGPGALAQDYAQAGGTVRYIGKPWPAIYRAALAAAGLPPARLLAVGDSLAHDIQGAAAFGIANALVTSGIHREAFASAQNNDALLVRLAGLLTETMLAPRWLLARFQL